MGIKSNEAEAKPFLTIITRCFRRPKLLAVNIKAVDDQTDGDIQHLLFQDRKGVGIEGANKSFFRLRNHVEGQWVYLVDDDDLLIYPDFVKDLKVIVQRENPQVIMVKARMCGTGNVLPQPWKGAPVLCRLSTLNFVIRVDLWKEYIFHFGKPSAGDFGFFRMVWKAKPQVFWWDKLVAVAPCAAGGSSEPAIFDKMKKAKVPYERGR